MENKQVNTTHVEACKQSKLSIHQLLEKNSSSLNCQALDNIITIIKVSGSDCIKFIQGQFTNDINQLQNTQFQYSAHLNHKGRMLASFIIVNSIVNNNHNQPNTEPSFYFITDKITASEVLPRLKIFVMRSKVNIEVISNQNTSIFMLSEKLYNHVAMDTINKFKLPNSNFFICWDIADYIPEISKYEIDYNAFSLWKLYLIDNAIPFIYKETKELFTPQQVSFDLLGGISFTKGCYTGQEIVARTHYLGKVKRRLYYFISQHPLAIGAKIYSPLMDNQEVGIVVDYASVNSNSQQATHVIASIQENCIDNLFLDSNNQTQIPAVIKMEFDKDNG